MDGIHKQTWEYDQRGQVIRDSIFGVDGTPTMGRRGYAIIEYRYDQRGNTVAETRYDQAEVVGLEIRREFDAQGRNTRMSLFGPDGRAIVNPENWHSQVHVYDPQGRVAQKEFYDTEGNLTLHKEGFAIVQSGYDTRGRETSVRFMGADFRPVLAGWTGSNQIRYEYDVRGRMTRISHFDTEARPVVCRLGYHARRMRFDRWDNEISLEYLGADQEPMVNPLTGYARLERSVDQRGRVVELRYLDLSGQLTDNAQGVARVVYTYSPTGQRSEQAYNAAGQPVTPAAS